MATGKQLNFWLIVQFKLLLIVIRYIYVTKRQLQWIIGSSDGLTSSGTGFHQSGFNRNEGGPWDKSWKNNTTVTCTFLCGSDDGQTPAVDEGGSGDQRTEDLCQTTWIAAAAAAGVVIFILIISAISALVWKTERCNVFKQEIVENNEVYGAPENDYQYAKDQYNTKVFDDNDYYGH